MRDGLLAKSFVRMACVAAVCACDISVMGWDDPSGQQEGEAKELTQMEDKAKHPGTNRLSRATSPYLLQHAHNPVDWYEWGKEAFDVAKREDKPIFLSIGYAACHWCHVMAHECFEAQEVAAQMNEHFVNIKVDREERPDIDEIYMAYTQARTGGGGWPMSVWLTPEGVPFFAGTYFPADQFQSLLAQIADTWRNKREALEADLGRVTDFFKDWSASPKASADVLSRDDLDGAALRLAGAFDGTHGGVAGGQNKFPPSMAMELLLRVYRRTGKSSLFEAVSVTLDHMAYGGIYDHLGGGICRYSTDSVWLVPHFEKMLYDQALVSGIYLDAYQVSRDPLYAKTAADILDYCITDLQSPVGGFFSSRDADSDGLEGAFYIWTVAQVIEVLGDEEGRLCCEYYDVTDGGNWFERMGHAPAGPKNILHLSKSPKAFAKLKGLDLKELERRSVNWRKKLYEVRERRTHPGLDDKILTGWNGLLIASLAKAARVLDEPKYAAAAAGACDFILDEVRRDGRLLRTYRDGSARLTAYLSDYSFFVEGLLNLYEATFERKWLDHAVALTDLSIKHYADPNGGGFFFTAADAEKLVARSKSPNDGAIPAGNSVQAMNLLRLGILLNRKDYRARAESIFKAYSAKAGESVYSFERHLSALDFYHDRVKEIAIIGDPAAADTQALIRTVYQRFLPNKVVVQAADKVDDPTMPLLHGKMRKNGQATAYVCENYTCRLPVTTPEELAKALKRD